MNASPEGRIPSFDLSSGAASRAAPDSSSAGFQGYGPAVEDSIPHAKTLARDLHATIRAWGVEREIATLIAEYARNPDGSCSLADGIRAYEEELRRPRLARPVDGGIDILDPAQPGFAYEVDDRQLTDARSAWELVRQLSEKTWTSTTTLVDVANAALARLDALNGRTPAS
jgi:hypothetical protein